MADIEAAQQKVYDAILRHALDVERNTRGIATDMRQLVTSLVRELGPDLQERLEVLTDGELSRLASYQFGTSTKGLPSRVIGVINLVDKWGDNLTAQTLALWAEEAPEFMQVEMDFARDTLDGVLVPETAAVGVTAAQAYAQAMAAPMLGSFFEQDMTNATQYSKTIVMNTIREGVTNGETTNTIVRSIIGTKSLQYKDGSVNQTRNSVESLVRTGRTHLSNQAYEITYKALGAEKVIFVATLDGRTTLVCAGNDGNVYRVDERHPTPPLHRGCRSTLAPFLGGEIGGTRPYVKEFKPLAQVPKSERDVGNVKASTSMSEFLKRPSNSKFAREYFGEERYKLFMSGKISIKQMVRADGTKYSLDELRQKYRVAYDETFS